MQTWLRIEIAPQHRACIPHATTEQLQSGVKTDAHMSFYTVVLIGRITSYVRPSVCLSVCLVLTWKQKGAELERTVSRAVLIGVPIFGSAGQRSGQWLSLIHI